MSLMPSLCAALERAGGDRLVMRVGERPHVLAGDRRHDVASAVLSINAVEALAEQIFSAAGRHQLASTGSVSEPVESASFVQPLTAHAERVGQDFSIELIVSRAAEPAADEVMDEAPVDSPTPVEHVVEEQPPVEQDYPRPIEQDYSSEPASEPGPAVMPAEPEPVMQHYTEPEPPPVPTFVEEAPRYVPEPARHPEMTVVARVEEPFRAPLPLPLAGTATDLFELIARAAHAGATTLYLRPGSPASARIDDRIQPLGTEIVDESIVEDTAATFTRGGDGLWEPRPDGEWVREDEEVGYVSCRVFGDLQGQGLIIQLKPATSLRLLHKYIPRQVRAVCEGNGLVVVSASTEADVESLAAAVADWSGRDRGGYLISLQRRTRSYGDIAGAFVSQRTVGGSEKDLATAIRRAAQEGPDILLVTGLQSEQALQAAVLAAAGGRLVIVGVVAPTTVEALHMLSGSDTHLRRALAASFRAAIGYRSLRRLGGGRTLIQDVILASSTVSGLLEAGDFAGLLRSLRDGAPGVRSVDESLARAVTRRHISLRQAAGQAIDRSHLVALVRAQARAAAAAKRPAGSPLRVQASSGFNQRTYRREPANAMTGGAYSRS